VDEAVKRKIESEKMLFNQIMTKTTDEQQLIQKMKLMDGSYSVRAASH
jgi:hypothetical protein